MKIFNLCLLLVLVCLSRASFGTETIEIDGGKSTGDDCEAYAYHGYNGVEAATVERIKAWIVAGN